MINLLQTNVDTDSKKKDAVDAGPVDLQSSPEVNAEQALKGLGSKTVNYNLSNKRPLVHLQVLCFMLMLAAMLCSSVQPTQCLSVRQLMLFSSVCVMQEGMGYGMYFLVLPFFAWMVVLVVSRHAMCCLSEDCIHVSAWFWQG